jgi:poly [ADP-ribose] polymerase 2/3/4
MEMAQDVPDLPIGMLTDLHLKRGWAFSCSVSPIFLPVLSRVHHFAAEEMLLEWRRVVESVPEPGPAADAFWTETSNKWFTLFPTTRPYTMRGSEQIADNVSYIHCCG